LSVPRRTPVEGLSSQCPGQNVLRNRIRQANLTVGGVAELTPNYLVARNNLQNLEIAPSTYPCSELDGYFAGRIPSEDSSRLLTNFEPPHRRSSLSTPDAAKHQPLEFCSET
jgi:hypothetical protein